MNVIDLMLEVLHRGHNFKGTLVNLFTFRGECKAAAASATKGDPQANLQVLDVPGNR